MRRFGRGGWIATVAGVMVLVVASFLPWHVWLIRAGVEPQTVFEYYLPGMAILLLAGPIAVVLVASLATVKRFGKVGWVAFIAGAIVSVLAGEVLLQVLKHAGADSRTAAGHCLMAMAFVAPAGGLAMALVGLLGQALRLPPIPSWAAALLFDPVGAIVNGLFWGAFAEWVAWARIRARPLFWVLVLGLGAYWALLLVLTLS